MRVFDGVVLGFQSVFEPYRLTAKRAKGWQALTVASLTMTATGIWRSLTFF
jgi:hypothetical protein